jgi:hypothetical protein
MYHQPASDFCKIGQTRKKGLGLFAKVKIEKGRKNSDDVAIKIETGGYEFSAAMWEKADFWEIS